MKKKLYLHFFNASALYYTRLILIGSIFLLQLIPTNLYAQKSVITGNVSDSTGPLSNVSILVQGTTLGTTTNSEGNYSIQTSENATLLFSLIGYNTQSINANNRKTVNVIMHGNNKSLGEVVVVGYGTQKKENLTGAITSIKGNALTLVPSSNLSNVLAGRLAGVYVAQSTGVPGISSSIRIRSNASWNNSAPLFVIDGVIRDQASFDALNPNDIGTISVLKDGASAAIYGARSSNGVVLVTTKKGHKGKPTLTYNATYLMEKPITKGATLLPAYKSAELNNAWSKPNLGYDWFGQDEIDYLKIHGGYNYLDYAYVTPSTMDHALNVSGGSDKVRYFIGGDVMNENGFLKKLKFNKYNLRASVDVSITENLTASMQLSSNYSERQTINFGGSDDISGMYGKLSQFFFYVPPYINGNIVNPGWIGNPLGLINNSGYVKSNRRGLDGLITLNYNVPFVKGLSVKVTYSKNDVSTGGKTYQIQHTLYNYKRIGTTQKIFTDTLLSISKAPYPGRPFLSVNNASQSSYQFNTQISYLRDFGKHHIEATILSEEYEGKNSNNYLTRLDFPIITTDQFFATSSNNSDSYGYGGESTIGRSSYVGRVNYQYNDKYLLSASLRADGSMIFAPGHRWGYFPSVSAGWRISKEDFFMKSFGKVFNQFKLRASLASTGNDAVTPWQWQEQYVPGGNAYFGNGLQPVIAYGGVVNKNLTWEKSRSTDFGLDMVTTFNLSMSLDYWHRNTYDILGNRIVSMPTTFGGTLPSENYGKVNSHGYEISLGYNHKAGDFAYSVNGNFAFATTKVIQEDFAPGGLAVDNPNGKPLGYTSGLISTGIIRTQKELDALPAGYTIYGAKPALGDLNYKDISGIDGKPDGKIDSYDRGIISNYSQGTAPYTAGLNMGISWKGISINVFFQSTFGYPKLYNDNWGRGFPLDAAVNTWWADMWTPDNPNGKIPKWQVPGEPNSMMTSSFWYDKGGYVRLKNLTLAYDLPERWLKKINAQRISIDVTGTNLFFLSQFKWYDPEINNLNSYPNMKTLNLGLNITL